MIKTSGNNIYDDDNNKNISEDLIEIKDENINNFSKLLLYEY